MILVHAAEATQAKAAAGRLAAEAARLRVAGAAVAEHLLAGAPHEAILDFCGKNRARLVVRDAAVLEDWLAEKRPLRVFVSVNFRYACTIVVTGGTVHLLHVTHRLGLSEHEALVRLRALVPEEATARGIRFETSPWADPVAAHGIRQVVARLRSDVICLGARRRPGLAKSLLPSTAREVLEKSEIPVLLVRTPV